VGNPETGELEQKLHLHWRLTEPTRDAASHAKLKRCRSMAKDLAGADGTSSPMVHPMRWPGSWHRKGAPRLVRIVSETEAELDLDEAEQLLREAWSLHRQQHGDTAGKAEPDEPGEGETRDSSELISAILTGADYHAPITALSMRYLKGGMADPQVVLTLRGFMDSVPEAIAGRSEDAETVHGTQKPVECMRRPIENNSSPGQAVYEPFSGSGTTIIAAEMPEATSENSATIVQPCAATNERMLTCWASRPSPLLPCSAVETRMSPTARRGVLPPMRISRPLRCGRSSRTPSRPACSARPGGRAPAPRQ